MRGKLREELILVVIDGWKYCIIWYVSIIM